MKLRVRFFALYRQLVGSDETTLEAPGGCTLFQLWEQVKVLYPGLQPYPLIAAVNGEQGSGATPLQDGDEVAFLPPFSGGSQNTGVFKACSPREQGDARGGPPLWWGSGGLP